MPDSTQLHFAVADGLIFEKGEFDPLEFLVRIGALDELSYQDWLAGRRGELQSALLRDHADVIDALGQARAYVSGQGLVSSPPAAHGEPLGGRSVGPSHALQELCGSRLVSAKSQLDLFQDSALAVAEHAVRSAFGSRRLEAVAEALRRLQALGADTEDYRQLLNAARCEPLLVEEHLRLLEQTVAPLAMRCLGHYAHTFLTPQWQSLAVRLQAIAFDPTNPTLHASHAFGSAGQWRQVIEVIEREPAWPTSAVLTTRLAQAHGRQGTRQAARRLWSRLCWDHPRDAPTALQLAHGDPGLAVRWREFVDQDPELPTQDFPAWLLIADLSQRELVPASCAPQGATGVAYGAVYTLLHRHEDLSARRTVSQYNQDLLQHYLRRRHPEGY